MVWYSTGTVTATNNSATVTGSGTLFLANARVGDGITIAGSTSLHQITNIASDTQLTITPVYTGTTGSGKAYSIAPIQGYVKDLADQVKTLVLQYGALTASTALSALSTITPAADTIPYFTGTGTADKTAFTAQARTFVAATTQAAQRTVLGLGTAALGTVTTSTTAGTPGQISRIGDYGLGADGPIVDPDTAGQGSGSYSINTSSNLMPSWGAYLTAKYWGVDRKFQIGAVLSGAGAEAYYVRGQHANGVWSSRRQLWHDGNLEKQTSQTDAVAGRALVMGNSGVGPFGLGELALAVSDASSMTWSGFGRVTALSVPNLPNAGVGQLIGAPYSAGMAGLGAQLYVNYSNDVGNYRQAKLFLRAKSAAGSYFPWIEAWTTDNFDPTTKENSIAAGTTAQYWKGNKTWSDLATDVRAVALTGLSTATYSAVTAADTLLSAVGKLQGQTTASNLLSSVASSGFDTLIGSRFLRTAGDGPMGATIMGGLSIGVTNGVIEQQFAGRLGRFFVRSKGDTSNTEWRELYHNYNVVGTVSQSSGLPTGAIIERGSNANGEYVRFADGTQICTTASINTSAFAANSTANAVAVTWAATFAAVPKVSGNAHPATTNDHFGVTSIQSISTVGANVIVRNGGTSQTFTVTAFAVGRWY